MYSAHNYSRTQEAVSGGVAVCGGGISDTDLSVFTRSVLVHEIIGMDTIVNAYIDLILYRCLC